MDDESVDRTEIRYPPSALLQLSRCRVAKMCANRNAKNPDRTFWDKCFYFLCDFVNHSGKAKPPFQMASPAGIGQHLKRCTFTVARAKWLEVGRATSRPRQHNNWVRPAHCQDTANAR